VTQGAPGREHEPSSCPTLGQGPRGTGCRRAAHRAAPHRTAPPGPFPGKHSQLAPKTKCLPQRGKKKKKNTKKKRQLQPRNSHRQVLFLKHYYFVHFELVCFSENGQILKRRVLPPSAPREGGCRPRAASRRLRLLRRDAPRALRFPQQLCTFSKAKSPPKGEASTKTPTPLLYLELTSLRLAKPRDNS